MRLLLIFILFVVVEYALRTFIEPYKYHEVRWFLEFLPLIIATLIGGIIYKNSILNEHFGWTYLKLISISTSGLLMAKTLLFIQWYWLIVPEYRSIPGDMSEGLAWTVFFSVIGSIIISLTYLGEILTIKAFQKRR